MTTINEHHISIMNEGNAIAMTLLRGMIDPITGGSSVHGSESSVGMLSVKSGLAVGGGSASLQQNHSDPSYAHSFSHSYSWKQKSFLVKQFEAG